MIDAILEGKTTISNCDNVEEHNSHVTAVMTSTEATSLLSERSNIYDHDEFDVFHHDDIDLSRVHIGKK